MVSTNHRPVAKVDKFGTKSTSKKNPMVVLRAARANFDVEKMPLSGFMPRGMSCLPTQHVVVRKDTDTVIGQVGPDYTPISNADFFCPIAEQLVNESGAEIERFSSVDDGRHAFMKLSWPDERNIRIGDAKVGDIIGRRAVLSNSHDGTRRAKLVIEMLRLACLNGMTVPVGKSEWYMTHTIGGKEQLADILKMLPEIERYVNQFAAAGDILANTSVQSTDKVFNKIIKSVVDPRNSAKTKKSGDLNRAAERMEEVSRLFVKQPMAEHSTMKNTAWGLFNAFADFYNHSGKANAQQRFKALVPGKNGGERGKSIIRAWDTVIDELKLKKTVDDAVKAILSN